MRAVVAASSCPRWAETVTKEDASAELPLVSHAQPGIKNPAVARTEEQLVRRWPNRRSWA